MGYKIRYLQYLSNFWTMYYEDYHLLDASLYASAEKIKSLYFAFLQRHLPRPVLEFPIFKESFWNVLELKYEDSKAIDSEGNIVADPSQVEFISYPLDEPYAEVPYLYDIIYKPNVILKSGTISELTTDIPSGGLVVKEQYLNEHSTAIINNGISIPAYTKFFAGDETYTGGNDSGKVVRAKDFYIKRVSQINPQTNEVEVKSSIWFKIDSDPYFNPDIPKRQKNNSNDTYMTFYAPKVFLDHQELYKYYGAILDIFSISSKEYRDLLAGLYKLYLKGPTQRMINSALNLASGYPSAFANEIVVKVVVTKDFFYLHTEQANIYEIERKEIQEYNINDSGALEVKHRAIPKLKLSGKQVQLTDGTLTEKNKDFYYPDQEVPEPVFGYGEYNVFSPVKKFDTFIDNLKIVDYNSEQYWWRAQTIKRLLEDIVDLSSNKRSNQFIINYLFEHYLKYNTFGVFIDINVLREFNVLQDFFQIINDVKPTGTRFIVSENDVTVVSEDSSQVTDSVDILPYFYIIEDERIRYKVGMRVRGASDGLYNSIGSIKLGMRIKNLGNTHDLLKLSVLMKSDIDLSGNPTKYSISSTYDTESYSSLLLGRSGARLGRLKGIMEKVILNWVDKRITPQSIFWYPFFETSEIKSRSANLKKFPLNLYNTEWVEGYNLDNNGLKFLPENNSCAYVEYHPDLNSNSFSINWTMKYNDINEDQILFDRFSSLDVFNSSFLVALVGNKLRIYILDVNTDGELVPSPLCLVYESDNTLFDVDNVFNSEFSWDYDTKTMALRVNKVDVDISLLTSEDYFHSDKDNMGLTRKSTEPFMIGKARNIFGLDLSNLNATLYNILYHGASRDLSETEDFYDSLEIA